MDNPILALITSFFAMSFVVTSYFMKKKEKYLLFQFLCIVFLIISYFFTEQFFAMVGLVIGLGRTLTFFLYERKGKNASILWAFLFSGLSLASYLIINLLILGDAQPLDILFLVGLIGYAFIFRIRNLTTGRFLMLIPTFLSVMFNVLTDAALFATLSYTFELSANILSILKFHVFAKKEKMPIGSSK
ncbi:MAG: YgjV family protein [Clostridia bacterium]|nr:YgjV family protein [Clostridia bacterium]